MALTNSHAASRQSLQDLRTTPPSPKPAAAAVEVPSKKETSVSMDAVAGRAYEKYLSRAGEHGHDQEDWYEAERELLIESKGE